MDTLLEINDKDLFKGLRVCKLKTPPSDTQSFPKKKETVRVLRMNNIFLRRIRPALSASGLA